LRIWLGEDAGLGGGGGAAGAVGLGTLAGEAVAVLGRFREEVECLGCKAKLVLGDWLAAAFSFHGSGIKFVK
jgi:hypothetical protein